MAIIDIRGAVVLLDDEDMDLVLKYKWWILPQGYAVTMIKRTDSQNGRNISTAKGKTSLHRGVSFHGGKWQVVIRVNSKLKWLGHYKTELEAAAIAAPYFADIAA